MTTTVANVTGMTCEHCVRAVSTEVGGLPGVSDVQVNLESGTVTITSDGPLPPDALRSAIDEAGYELRG